MNSNLRIAFGGSCHWCTEAIFQSLSGVQKVEQGWLASTKPNDHFSEGVIVHFDGQIISLAILIEVHLYSHSCTSNHAFRNKYRSAVYYFDKQQKNVATKTLSTLAQNFDDKIITEVLAFSAFKMNKLMYQNYYTNNPSKPFCQNYIEPKLRLVISQFSNYVKHTL